MDRQQFSGLKKFDKTLKPSRTFNFRLKSTHTDPANTIATLTVEHCVNDIWHPFVLNVHTPGFQILIYACFICQHTYLCMSATDQNLTLDVVNATFQVTTTQDWHVLAAEADFDAYLRAGDADEQCTRHLINRMQGCPVARNLSEGVAKQTRLVVYPANAVRFDPQRSRSVYPLPPSPTAHC